MPEPSTVAVFALAALALIVVPGPSVLYVVGQGLAHGRRAALVSAAGIEAGGLVHVAAAAAGLSAIVVSSATAFAVLKYAGAAYLVLLGLRELRGGGGGAKAPAAPAGSAPLRRVFWRGALVNALNPKTALFFLAFLPQFVDPARGPVAVQTAVLGAVFLAIAAICDSVWALAAGALGPRLRDGLRSRVRRFGSGGVFVALGVGTALSATRRSI